METLLKIIGAVGLFLIVALLVTFPTMWLWNWLMPTIFGVVKITFWQALGLNLLTGVLFRQTNRK